MRQSTREFIAEVEEMGLEVRHGQGGHMKVYTPDGRWVMDFAHSSSDRNWDKQAMRRLRTKLVRLYG